MCLVFVWICIVVRIQVCCVECGWRCQAGREPSDGSAICILPAREPQDPRRHTNAQHGADETVCLATEDGEQERGRERLDLTIENERGSSKTKWKQNWWQEATRKHTHTQGPGPSTPPQRYIVWVAVSGERQGRSVERRGGSRIREWPVK